MALPVTRCSGDNTTSPTTSQLATSAANCSVTNHIYDGLYRPGNIGLSAVVIGTYVTDRVAYCLELRLQPHQCDCDHELDDNCVIANDLLVTMASTACAPVPTAEETLALGSSVSSHDDFATATSSAARCGAATTCLDAARGDIDCDNSGDYADFDTVTPVLDADMPRPNTSASDLGTGSEYHGHAHLHFDVLASAGYFYPDRDQLARTCASPSAPVSSWIVCLTASDDIHAHTDGTCPTTTESSEHYECHKSTCFQHTTGTMSTPVAHCVRGYSGTHTDDCATGSAELGRACQAPMLGSLRVVGGATTASTMRSSSTGSRAIPHMPIVRTQKM